METFLLVSENTESPKKYIDDFRVKHKIDPIDCTFLSVDESLGIEAVRNLQKNIFLKPLKSKEKIIIINNFQTATTEAQNAMLKVLEEPPANTFIFLQTDTTDHLLETVISRCLVIKLDKKTKSPNENLDDFGEKLNEFEKFETHEFLKLAQDLATEKESAISWLRNAILIYRGKMLKDQDYKYVKTIEKLQQAYKFATTTNTNLRFLLENTFLSN